MVFSLQTNPSTSKMTKLWCSFCFVLLMYRSKINLDQEQNNFGQNQKRLFSLNFEFFPMSKRFWSSPNILEQFWTFRIRIGPIEKPRTSNLRTNVLLYDSPPESQYDWNFELLLLFQPITEQLCNLIGLLLFVIGWNYSFLPWIVPNFFLQTQYIKWGKLFKF